MQIGSLENWNISSPLKKFYVSVFGSPVLNVKYNWYLLGRYLVPLLKNNVAKNTTILDIGCGDGKFSNLLSYKYGVLCHGVDRLSELITIAEKTAEKYSLSNKFYNTVVEKLSLNTSYEHIICMDVLEHVDKPPEFLRLLRSLLNENGKVFIRTPHLKDKKIFFTENQEFDYGEDVHVTSGFTIETINKYAADAGLRVTYYEYNYHFFGQLLWEFSELLWKIRPAYYLFSYPIYWTLLLIENIYRKKDAHANGIFFILEWAKS